MNTPHTPSSRLTRIGLLLLVLATGACATMPVGPFVPRGAPVGDGIPVGWSPDVGWVIDCSRAPTCPTHDRPEPGVPTRGVGPSGGTP